MRQGRHASEGRIQPSTFWALVRHPKALPILFMTYQEARENCDADEYLVQVDVTATNPRFTLPRWSRAER